MKIIIVRHAIAEELLPSWEGKDEERPLTDEGKKKFKKALKSLQNFDLSPDAIFTSPLVRAKQTAELIRKNLFSKEIPIHETDSMKPESLARLPEEVKAFPAESQLILVGHNPHLTHLASYLLAGHEELSIDIRKGSIIILSIEDPSASGTAKLEGFFTQKQLISVQD